MSNLLEKHQFWCWLLILFLLWGKILLSYEEPLSQMPWEITAAALYFALFFMIPVLKNKEKVLFGIFALKISLITFTFSQEPIADDAVLLLYIILLGASVFYLKATYILLTGVLAWLSASVTVSTIDNVLFIIYILISAMALFIYQRTLVKERELRARSETLFSEYRKMKRELISGEKAVREEERTQIAREIHDSVGHKLTALLMQLEVFRLKSPAPAESDIQGLKQLAKESLEETRNAVKALKQEESGGLPAVIQLIRKLEAESLIRI